MCECDGSHVDRVGAKEGLGHMSVPKLKEGSRGDMVPEDSLQELSSGQEA